jgi:hypothetical protein
LASDLVFAGFVPRRIDLSFTARWSAPGYAKASVWARTSGLWGTEGSRRFIVAPLPRTGYFLLMALDDERCRFRRRAVTVPEWTARRGWLEIECPVCGLYRVERQFRVTAHFKKVRQPFLYRRLA